MVSISSLPFNCSQLEHAALWRIAAAAKHRHTCTQCRGHSVAPVRRCSRCAQGSGVLVQFVPESWVTRTQSFHRLSLECEHNSQHGEKCESTLWWRFNMNMQTSAWKCCFFSHFFLKYIFAAAAIFTRSCKPDWLLYSFAPGPHNEVSVTATTSGISF